MCQRAEYEFRSIVPRLIREKRHGVVVPHRYVGIRIVRHGFTPFTVYPAAHAQEYSAKRLGLLSLRIRRHDVLFT